MKRQIKAEPQRDRRGPPPTSQLEFFQQTESENRQRHEYEHDVHLQVSARLKRGTDLLPWLNEGGEERSSPEHRLKVVAAEQHPADELGEEGNGRKPIKALRHDGSGSRHQYRAGELQIDPGGAHGPSRRLRETELRVQDELHGPNDQAGNYGSQQQAAPSNGRRARNSHRGGKGDPDSAAYQPLMANLARISHR